MTCERALSPNFFGCQNWELLFLTTTDCSICWREFFFALLRLKTRGDVQEDHWSDWNLITLYNKVVCVRSGGSQDRGHSQVKSWKINLHFKVWYYNTYYNYTITIESISTFFFSRIPGYNVASFCIYEDNFICPNYCNVYNLIIYLTIRQ